VTDLGTVYGTTSALKRMLARNRGCIVQVGSALAYRSIPLKAAVPGGRSEFPKCPLPPLNKLAYLVGEDRLNDLVAVGCPSPALPRVAPPATR
jgi:hypothetical protein